MPYSVPLAGTARPCHVLTSEALYKGDRPQIDHKLCFGYWYLAFLFMEGGRGIQWIRACVILKSALVLNNGSFNYVTNICDPTGGLGQLEGVLIRLGSVTKIYILKPLPR